MVALVEANKEENKEEIKLMASRDLTAHLYDPSRGDPAIRTQALRSKGKPVEPARTNYFAIYHIASGSGTVWADASTMAFEPSTLLFFVPYQQLRFVPDTPIHGAVIEFHANFLCVETFHAESGCSGILFNDPYGLPVLALPEPGQSEIVDLMGRLDREQRETALAHGEIMLCYLKALLILAARIKSSRIQSSAPADGTSQPFDFRQPVIAQLRELIEKNYQSLHAPADYAEQMHMSPKTLGRIVRDHLGTTLTDLIRNRILVHAKWQILHTLKPVKEIARELGFSDELYFSRLFKKATGHSPTFFREFETRIRGGSNLSMFSGEPPISK